MVEMKRQQNLVLCDTYSFELVSDVTHGWYFSRLPRRTGAFIENSPIGARQGCRASAEGQEPLLLTLDKSEERRK
ncbi:hypothetical protein Mettu_4378 [Methylobacter tundripaludum SV96]|uniref:Uncharacterized protein n=1 Tax=Methylobacter tundripaludum (strain ATCC BAA-1195 / DSM 17260 / SV96) TaxID=697282 RepID=G3IYJ3_METTV|nr:hypothetical protein Mettu_4378 [Methylobacter tundripaludum SV96]